MPHTTAAVLKTRLDAAALGVPVQRAEDPRPRVAAYIDIEENISVTPERDGDFGDATAVQGVTEEAQVNVWQRRRNEVGAVAEDYDLHHKVVRTLHGATLSSGGGHVYGCRVVASARLIEEAGAVVHHAITVELRRDL